MTYFAVVREPGPAWRPESSMRDQDGWVEHASFMDALAEEGFIVLGGPIAGGRRFMFLVKAGSEAEVGDRLAGDPWTASEQIHLTSVEPWQLVLGNLARG